MATSPSYHGDYSDKDQPTLGTVVDLVADARTLLMDVVPDYRYDDQSMLVALNVTLLETRRLRPDLFVYNLETNGQVQAFTAIDDTYVAIESPFRLAILNGMCAHALMRDQEDVQDVRATTFLGMFNAGLIGRSLAGVAGGSSPGGPQQGPR
jgi:hypothetical protein